MPSRKSRPRPPQPPKAPSASQTLTEVTRGLHLAVNSAQTLLQHHYLRMLESCFNKDGTPKQANFRLSPEQVLDVPLVTLVAPKALALDELSLDLSLRVDETQVDKLESALHPVSASGFSVSVAPGGDGTPDSNEIRIHMRFKAEEPPEAVSRLIDEFVTRVRPRATS